MLPNKEATWYDIRASNLCGNYDAGWLKMKIQQSQPQSESTENGNGATQSGRTLFIKFREALVMLSIQIRRESAGGQRPLGIWFIFELRSAFCVGCVDREEMESEKI